MGSKFPPWRAGLALGLALLLAACTGTYFEPPEMQGRPLMVNDGGEPRLWVLNKVEEIREVRTGSGRRTSGSWRRDTFYHFEVQAFDPAAARPLWKVRLVTYGDREAKGSAPSRIIGSSVSARLLGQDGDVVWLLVDAEPWAISARDGRVLADGAGLQERNPVLAGLLPDEARHYGFDQGLVLMSADARPFVVRGPELRAEAYAPVPPPKPEPERRANGRERIVPLLPLGEVPARQVMLEGKWLGLYSEKEATEAANDEWGDNLRYPYRVHNEGPMARRTLWSVRISREQRFDEVFDRIAGLDPIQGTPTFLKGRFLKDLATGEPRLLASPKGVAVWHSTRIDGAGRLALSRLDAGLRILWTAELPLSESDTANPVTYWQLPERLVVMGLRQSERDEVVTREPFLVSLSLADGTQQAWNLREETPLP